METFIYVCTLTENKRSLKFHHNKIEYYKSRIVQHMEVIATTLVAKQTLRIYYNKFQYSYFFEINTV